MPLRLVAVSALVAALGVGGAVIPGLCAESDAPAQPVPVAATMVAEQAQTAPEFVGINNWFNSPPLKLADLRGKVVLVDFWTYGCVNCVNTLPHVTKLYSKYRDRGLVVVGVHTPEFPFEHSASNVQAALKRHGILYPVAQDNNSQTWNAYRNQYWPAQYIIDQNGKIVFQHAGEGQYDEIDRTVARLLSANS
ncbi:Thiol-disulfide oxidoreductase YkuV [Bradyrhizobium ivorense]|uniref:Thiol-disulfide oxidoreductase YkuV n=1 Tax=Bradyrhizobium ivorense TaxID=2511166 RepID=A0A508T111_9BRAD|nr:MULTISPECIES: thioredoxin family protein [Bradyrhizobium]MCC8937244.1 thioredoxin family protein [Bradyrhizobium ivorense]QOZ22797.1 thioredoxin [Bradyrhizobium sp. CCBAU 51753]VIO67541.1 Thiol-disulfide oxidoreductase YkuV [Bradyrhizobium ivorense]VIO68170.1 Thiol-disulfide oxidoreductase YkuV [Bradyrhizobium ivorense]